MNWRNGSKAVLAAMVAFETGSLTNAKKVLGSDKLCTARRFKCPFVRLAVDSPGDEPTPEEIVSRLRPVVAEFRAANIRLGIENHDRLRSRTLAWIVEQLGPANVGICLDTVNSFGALEGLEVVVQTLAPFTFCLHAKDFTIRRVSHRMGFVLEGCPAGQGQLDSRGCSPNSRLVRTRSMSYLKPG